MIAMRGQQLSEYALVMGLVVIVSIAGLVQLGGTLQNQLNGTISMRSEPSATGTTLTTTTGGLAAGVSNPLAGGSTPTPGVPLSPVPSYASNTLCIKPTLCVYLPAYGEQGVSAEEAAGGLGGDMTAQYADVLSQLVAALQADPDMAGVDIQALVTLANKGHDLASNLQGLQAQCAQQGGAGPCSLDYKKNTKEDPINQRQLFENQLAMVEKMLATEPRLPAAVKEMVLQVADQIIDVHEASVDASTTVEAGVKSKNRCERKEAKGKKIPKSCQTTSISNHLEVDTTQDANVITVDANAICDAGTSQNAQCTVAPTEKTGPFGGHHPGARLGARNQ